MTCKKVLSRKEQKCQSSITQSRCKFILMCFVNICPRFQTLLYLYLSKAALNNCLYFAVFFSDFEPQVLRTLKMSTIFRAVRTLKPGTRPTSEFFINDRAYCNYALYIFAKKKKRKKKWRRINEQPFFTFFLSCLATNNNHLQNSILFKILRRFSDKWDVKVSLHRAGVRRMNKNMSSMQQYVMSIFQATSSML